MQYNFELVSHPGKSCSKILCMLLLFGNKIRHVTISLNSVVQKSFHNYYYNTICCCFQEKRTVYDRKIQEEKLSEDVIVSQILVINTMIILTDDTIILFCVWLLILNGMLLRSISITGIAVLATLYCYQPLKLKESIYVF